MVEKKSGMITHPLSAFPSSSIFSNDNTDIDFYGVDPRYSFCSLDIGMSNSDVLNA